MKAVIMCGGAGSRLRPLTENKPKPLVKLLNIPVLEIIINKLIKSGISEIYISLGYMANKIIEYCEMRHFDAEIMFCEEAKPLGTAGGVKNCLKESDEDILVLSGDNVFDFDLNEISRFHEDTNADFTVVGTTAADPREYGTVLMDDDSSIRSFVEKPTWEQAESCLINTGIYLFKGEILGMIPENTFYDFSENLFPEIFRETLNFMCCKADGFWGDIGEPEAYFSVTHDILDGKMKNAVMNGRLISSDYQDGNLTNFIAPCLIGENVTIGKGCTIGPYTVIDNGCVIGDECCVEDAVIGENCVIKNNSEIHRTLTADNVTLCENTATEDNCVIGYGAKIGRFSRILQGSRIWPGKHVSPEAVISRDLFYETPENIEFDVFGISGKIYSQFTLTDAVKIGQAIASLKNTKKIGIGCDVKNCSKVYKNACASGIQSCNVLCYDFDEILKLRHIFIRSTVSLMPLFM